MTLKLASTLSALALALVVSAPQSYAKVYTPAQFNAELKKRLTKKTNAAAITQASAFLKTALLDKANAKYLVQYTQLTVGALKKPKVIATNLQAKTAAELAKSFTTGYFVKNAYDIDNPNFVKALKLSLTLVTGASRTTPNAKLIAAQYLALVKKKGNKPADINFVNNTVYKALGQKPPTPVS